MHGEHLVRELGTEDEIFQMPDETDSLVLPLQGRRRRHGMPRGNHVSWEMPLEGRYEAMGEDCAQELECPIQEREESIAVDNAQELRFLVQAREEAIRAENAKGFTAPIEDPATGSTNVDPSRSHFMLRQQQMLGIDVSKATDQHEANGS